uniref:Uncharacterized protein n=1 Tax=Hordeum vulgare subsp. vulgare TaxID=112509 RepID=A0A8I6YH06_HORVV
MLVGCVSSVENVGAKSMFAPHVCSFTLWKSSSNCLVSTTALTMFTWLHLLYHCKPMTNQGYLLPGVVTGRFNQSFPVTSKDT